MIAGIVIDTWKLPIFTRHLKAAGMTYTQHPGVVVGTALLKVDITATNDAKRIRDVATQAAQEAARVGEGPMR